MISVLDYLIAQVMQQLSSANDKYSESLTRRLFCSINLIWKQTVVKMLIGKANIKLGFRLNLHM